MAIALTLGLLFAVLCVVGFVFFGIATYKVYDDDTLIGWRIGKWVCLTPSFHSTRRWK